MNVDWYALFNEVADWAWRNEPWSLLLFVAPFTLLVVAIQVPFAIRTSYMQGFQKLDPRRQEMKKAGDGAAFMLLAFMMPSLLGKVGIAATGFVALGLFGMFLFGLFWLITGWRRSHGMRDSRNVAYAWKRIALGIVLGLIPHFTFPYIYTLLYYDNRRYLGLAGDVFVASAMWFAVSGIVILILALKGPPPLRQQSPVPINQFPYGRQGPDDPPSL